MIELALENSPKQYTFSAWSEANVEVFGERELLKVTEVAFLGRPKRRDSHSDNSQSSRLEFTQREQQA